MQSFENKIAVVTGGGTGMGRELVVQLIAAGAHVAMCDVSEANMAETASLVTLAEDQRLSQHVCDVADEAAVVRFRNAVKEAHQTESINLLFNNAGIGGGGAVVAGDRVRMRGT